MHACADRPRNTASSTGGGALPHFEHHRLRYIRSICIRDGDQVAALASLHEAYSNRWQPPNVNG